MPNKGFIGKERFEETFKYQTDKTGKIQQMDYLFTR